MKGIIKYWDKAAQLFAPLSLIIQNNWEGEQKETNRWVVLISLDGDLVAHRYRLHVQCFRRTFGGIAGWAVPDIMMAFAINSAVGPIPMIFGGYFIWPWLGQNGSPASALCFSVSASLSPGKRRAFSVVPDLRHLRRLCAETSPIPFASATQIRFFPDKKAWLPVWSREAWAELWSSRPDRECADRTLWRELKLCMGMGRAGRFLFQSVHPLGTENKLFLKTAYLKRFQPKP